MTPQGLNYLELCKAILSQVSPGLQAPLKKANTKECGVQVNAKVDQIVQCSLGPKTLFCLEGDQSVPSKFPKSPDLFKQDGKVPHSTPLVSNLRFLRPVSIYSPVFDRRIPLGQLGGDGGSEREAEAAEHVESDKDAEVDQSREDTEKVHKSSKGSNFQVSLFGNWMMACMFSIQHRSTLVCTTLYLYHK